MESGTTSGVSVRRSRRERRRSNRTQTTATEDSENGLYQQTWRQKRNSRFEQGRRKKKSSGRRRDRPGPRASPLEEVRRLPGKKKKKATGILNQDTVHRLELLKKGRMQRWVANITTLAVNAYHGVDGVTVKYADMPEATKIESFQDKHQLLKKPFMSSFAHHMCKPTSVLGGYDCSDADCKRYRERLWESAVAVVWDAATDEYGAIREEGGDGAVAAAAATLTAASAVVVDLHSTGDGSGDRQGDGPQWQQRNVQFIARVIAAVKDVLVELARDAYSVPEQDDGLASGYVATGSDSPLRMADVVTLPRPRPRAGDGADPTSDAVLHLSSKLVEIKNSRHIAGQTFNDRWKLTNSVVLSALHERSFNADSFHTTLSWSRDLCAESTSGRVGLVEAEAALRAALADVPYGTVQAGTVNPALRTVLVRGSTDDGRYVRTVAVQRNRRKLRVFDTDVSTVLTFNELKSCVDHVLAVDVPSDLGGEQLGRDDGDNDEVEDEDSEVELPDDDESSTGSGSGSDNGEGSRPAVIGSGGGGERRAVGEEVTAARRGGGAADVRWTVECVCVHPTTTALGGAVASTASSVNQRGDDDDEDLDPRAERACIACGGCDQSKNSCAVHGRCMVCCLSICLAREPEPGCRWSGLSVTGVLQQLYRKEGAKLRKQRERAANASGRDARRNSGAYFYVRTGTRVTRPEQAARAAVRSDPPLSSVDGDSLERMVLKRGVSLLDAYKMGGSPTLVFAACNVTRNINGSYRLDSGRVAVEVTHAGVRCKCDVFATDADCVHSSLLGHTTQRQPLSWDVPLLKALNLSTRKHSSMLKPQYQHSVLRPGELVSFGIYERGNHDVSSARASDRSAASGGVVESATHSVQFAVAGDVKRSGLTTGRYKNLHVQAYRRRESEQPELVDVRFSSSGGVIQVRCSCGAETARRHRRTKKGGGPVETWLTGEPGETARGEDCCHIVAAKAQFDYDVLAASYVKDADFLAPMAMQSLMHDRRLTSSELRSSLARPRPTAATPATQLLSLLQDSRSWRFDPANACHGELLLCGAHLWKHFQVSPRCHQPQIVVATDEDRLPLRREATLYRCNRPPLKVHVGTHKCLSCDRFIHYDGVVDGIFCLNDRVLFEERLLYAHFDKLDTGAGSAMATDYMYNELMYDIQVQPECRMKTVSLPTYTTASKCLAMLTKDERSNAEAFQRAYNGLVASLWCDRTSSARSPLVRKSPDSVELTYNVTSTPGLFALVPPDYAASIETTVGLIGERRLPRSWPATEEESSRAGPATVLSATAAGSSTTIVGDVDMADASSSDVDMIDSSPPSAATTTATTTTNAEPTADAAGPAPGSATADVEMADSWRSPWLKSTVKRLLEAQISTTPLSKRARRNLIEKLIKSLDSINDEREYFRAFDDIRRYVSAPFRCATCNKNGGPHTVIVDGLHTNHRWEFHQMITDAYSALGEVPVATFEDLKKELPDAFRLSKGLRDAVTDLCRLCDGPHIAKLTKRLTATLVTPTRTVDEQTYQEGFGSLDVKSLFGLGDADAAGAEAGAAVDIFAGATSDDEHDALGTDTDADAARDSGVSNDEAAGDAAASDVGASQRTVHASTRARRLAAAAADTAATTHPTTATRAVASASTSALAPATTTTTTTASAAAPSTEATTATTTTTTTTASARSRASPAVARNSGGASSLNAQRRSVPSTEATTATTTTTTTTASARSRASSAVARSSGGGASSLDAQRRSVYRYVDGCLAGLRKHCNSSDPTTVSLVKALARLVGSFVFQSVYKPEQMTWRRAIPGLVDLFRRQTSVVTLFMGAGGPLELSSELCDADLLDDSDATPARQELRTAKILVAASRSHVEGGDVRRYVAQRHQVVARQCRGSVTSLASSLQSHELRFFEPAAVALDFIVDKYEDWMRRCAATGVNSAGVPVDQQLVDQATRLQGSIDADPWKAFLFTPLNDGLLCARRYRLLPPASENEAADSNNFAGADRKHFETARAQRSGGSINICCPHGVLLVVKKLKKGESANIIARLLVECFENAPQLVIYDNGCLLGKYCTSRFPTFFKDTSFKLDRWHGKTHSACARAALQLYQHSTYDSINTSAAEQYHSQLKRIAPGLSAMSHTTWALSIVEFSKRYNGKAKGNRVQGRLRVGSSLVHCEPRPQWPSYLF